MALPTVLGAYPGDVQACLNGDQEACDRVYFGYYVWPYLMKMLERMDIELIPKPPEPVPPWSKFDFQHKGIDSFIKADPHPQPSSPVRTDPHPQPNLPAIKARLEAATKFRDGLQELVTGIDKEIIELKKNL